MKGNKLQCYDFYELLQALQALFLFLFFMYFALNTCSNIYRTEKWIRQYLFIEI